MQYDETGKVLKDSLGFTSHKEFVEQNCNQVETPNGSDKDTSSDDSEDKANKTNLRNILIQQNSSGHDSRLTQDWYPADDAITGPGAGEH